MIRFCPTFNILGRTSTNLTDLKPSTSYRVQLSVFIRGDFDSPMEENFTTCKNIYYYVL